MFYVVLLLVIHLWGFHLDWAGFISGLALQLMPADADGRVTLVQH